MVELDMFHVEQNNNFDILIIGGGHAGLEAAWAANQFQGVRVGIITMPGVPIASAPCNPAVGGVGKGQVVREIDALGGLMGELADRSAIQYRTLNESKGFAVQSTRVQIDKELYSLYAEEVISNSSIIVIREKVDRVSKNYDESFTIIANGRNLNSKRVVVTTGTFLNGKMHKGDEITSGGRVDSYGSVSLNDLFAQVKSLNKRFKTGTPPRIKKSSIDFDKMEIQPSDPNSQTFHWKHLESDRKLAQLNCYLTRTNVKTLDIIRKNKEKSPIFNGQIEGVGPRYCPSIEDKAYRYTDKNVHHVFVEPEGINLNTFYPNGISTSLPKDIQEDFLRTIVGLEGAEIDVYGYAVEYDVVDTTYLTDCLEYIDIRGLYFAGQVCGTSGYEEAAGQGLVAGLNAYLSLTGDKRVLLSREDSYIGVMIDDLTGNMRDEPYRLFTARSENRLMIREDNAIKRMSTYRKSLGLDKPLDRYITSFEAELKALEAVIKSCNFMPSASSRLLFEENRWGRITEKTSLTELLKRGVLDPVEALTLILEVGGLSFDSRVVRQAAVDAKYEGYIKRAKIELDKYSKLAKKKIVSDYLVDDKNLSNECRQRISNIRPQTFGQLQRIEGIRPATVAYVAANFL